MLDAENPAENVDPSASGPDATNSVPTDTTPESAADQPADAPTAPATGDEPAETDTAAPAKKAPAKRSAAKKSTAKKTTKKTTAKRTTKKAASSTDEDASSEGSARPEPSGDETAPATAATENADPGTGGQPEATPAAKKTAKRTAKKATGKRAAKATPAPEAPEDEALDAEQATAPTTEVAQPAAEAPEGEEGDLIAAAQEGSQPASAVSATALLFQPPDPTKAVVTRRRRATRPEAPADAETGEGAAPTEPAEREPEKLDMPEKPARKGGKKSAKARSAQAAEPAEAEAPEERPSDEGDGAEGDGAEGDRTEADRTEADEQAGERRRRRRGGRRRRRSGGGEDNGSAETDESGSAADQETSEGEGEAEEGEESTPSGSRRRRRRRRSGEGDGDNGDQAEGSSARSRRPRNAEDEITAVTGSTRLEAKKQRRREGREAGRRRAPIVSEAEFLARRESVDRVMVIRQREDLTQIAVLEDKVLVEHYVSRESQTSLIGNVYLGRVQNVLPSMEAAFIDIGKGRNAVLYAGEVNWDALGAKNGQPRKIESVLKSGQTVLVQVTKDPVGHKGARLTSQISLPGRFLVYVPDGTTSGISRKLPDTERNRLKNLLKEIVPDTAGVIVRTAAEGASEEELTRDVERLRARWEDIEKKAAGGNAPQLLYGEPDLTLKVVRDLFTEDFNKLVISGDEAWEMVDGYVTHVAPDLADRLEKYDGERDAFAAYRIDEQIQKALDRKVWLPSGGSLVIDRTEAMTVVDVNTGKFTGSGGNLEETVTKNNLEAAEEIVRQLRLRDIGGIIVVDFIDMVLESNRDLVLRRLVECLGRDRTRHQVAEVTSLGLVQMTRKRIGTGLLEAFSESCEHCQGRGLVLHHEPVEPKKKAEDESRRGRRSGRGRGRDEAAAGHGGIPSPKDVAAMAKHEEKSDEAGPTAGKPAEVAADQRSAEVAEQAPADVAADQKSAEVGAHEGRAEEVGGGRGPAETALAEEASAGMTAAAPAGSEAASPEGAGHPGAPVETGPSRRSRGGRGRGRAKSAEVDPAVPASDLPEAASTEPPLPESAPGESAPTLSTPSESAPGESAPTVSTPIRSF